MKSPSPSDIRPFVIPALAALAQESRLAAYRMLVQAGPDGLPAGEIAGRLGIPPATASFHLAQLNRAGLIQCRTAGRYVIYSTDFERMNGLVAFLTENCCGGQSCAPACAPTATPTMAVPAVNPGKKS